MSVSRMHDAADDARLIEAYLRDGDDNALKALFGRHLRSIHGFLFRFTGSAQDAEDLTQETFIKAWRHLASVDPARGFRTWLFSIARRTAIDLLRKKKTVPFAAFEDDAGGNALLDRLEDEADLPDELVERKEAADMLRKALAELPPAFREVIVLRHESELSFREMADALEEPLNTVKSRYRRAFFALRKLLTGR